MNPNLVALVKELKNRAHIYVRIYRELAEELGREKAARILKSALYARGREKGVELARKLGRPDLHALALEFMEGQGDMDAFGHAVAGERPGAVILRLRACPLADAWAEAGLAEDERKLMCDIACQVDFGKFEAAGYRLSFNCRLADGGPSCDLEVTC